MVVGDNITVFGNDETGSQRTLHAFPRSALRSHEGAELVKKFLKFTGHAGKAELVFYHALRADVDNSGPHLFHKRTD